MADGRVVERAHSVALFTQLSACLATFRSYNYSSASRADTTSITTLVNNRKSGALNLFLRQLCQSNCHMRFGDFLCNPCAAFGDERWSFLDLEQWGIVLYVEVCDFTVFGGFLRGFVGFPWGFGGEIGSLSRTVRDVRARIARVVRSNCTVFRLGSLVFSEMGFSAWENRGGKRSGPPLRSWVRANFT